jgi:hypothetical protein
VNFGGDLAANRPQLNHQSWLVEYINEVKKSLFLLVELARRATPNDIYYVMVFATRIASTPITSSQSHALPVL